MGVVAREITASSAASPGNAAGNATKSATERIPPWSGWAKRNTKIAPKTTPAAVKGEPRVPGCVPHPCSLHEEGDDVGGGVGSSKGQSNATHTLSAADRLSSQMREDAPTTGNHGGRGLTDSHPHRSGLGRGKLVDVAVAVADAGVVAVKARCMLHAMLPVGGPAPLSQYIRSIHSS